MIASNNSLKNSLLKQTILQSHMRSGNIKEKDNVKAQYRNTRSKFYQKQKSFDTDDTKNEQTNTHKNTGNYWKEQGNQFFKARNFDKAIQCYFKAIEMNPGESQYYSNRSKCYQKLGNLNAALKDAEVACELDENNIKAHYICGCILGQLGKNDDSKLVKSQNRFKKALRLCSTLSTPEFSDDISIKLFRLKKMIWLKWHEKQLQVIQQQKQMLQKAYDKYEIAKPQFDLIIRSLDSRLQKLKEPHEIPDHLICKITLELMEDPVISEAGFTYQRKALEEHYKMKGPIEPISRKECRGIIIPNHALKISIQQFLNDNPWAFEFQEKEDYKSLIML